MSDGAPGTAWASVPSKFILEHVWLIVINADDVRFRYLLVQYAPGYI